MATGRPGSRVIGFYLTAGGRAIVKRARGIWPELEPTRYTKRAINAAWPDLRAVLFACASGIAVRAISDLVKDKATDPAVMVADEKGGFVVSLLGGHEAGANEMANELAAHIGAQPVLSTATDVLGLTSIDMFARDNGLVIENRDSLAKASGSHVRSGRLRVYTETDIALPVDYERAVKLKDADVIISHRMIRTKALRLRPRTLVLGIGCNRGTSAEEIRGLVRETFKSERLSELCIKAIATHDRKASEAGLVEYASSLGLRLLSYTSAEINTLKGISRSEAAMRVVGAQAVAEPCALLASGASELRVRKIKSGNVTIAIAETGIRGKLYIIGTGPGVMSHLTPKAMNALRLCDTVVGYKPYLAHIATLIEGKEVLASGMTEEVGRARAAVEAALGGKRVAVISGGDPGVYAMAGLVFEVVRSMDARVDMEVIPGISALNACASRLGAPLMHDFAVISLSDRLTPWVLIEKRIEAAAAADFVIVLYNPKSRGRATHIDRARELVMRHRGADTPVGIVSAAMREAERVVCTTLDRMLDHEINMQSTVVIGNSKTFRFGPWIVTPRGYADKYEV